MKTARLLAAAAGLCALTVTAAVAQTPPPRSFWTSGFNQGITEYQTGTFDQPIDGGLRLACLPGGGATIDARIKGTGPAARSRFRVIANNRRASRSFDLIAGPDGLAKFRASAPQFRALWAGLRGGTTVTLRFADDSFAELSLVGAARTLPVRACR